MKRLYDNTRLSDYRRCPRYYYFRHVRHWTTDAPALALIFGGAWHAAMDVIWAELPNGTPRLKVAAMASVAFDQYWVEAGMPPPEEIDYALEQQLAPRTPRGAQEMILGYIEARGPALERGDFDVACIERPFMVPLSETDEGLFYIGKIDKTVRRRDRLLGIEHKTTTAYSKSGKFRSTFLDSFSPNSQVYGYVFALTMMYGERVQGVWVDAALVHKVEEAFTFIPVEIRRNQLDMWLWETRSWIERLEQDLAALERVDPRSPHMGAFPRNTNSCFDFNKSCTYLDQCKAWPNPHGKPTPPGFIEQPWDPVDHAKLHGVLDGD